MEDREKNSHGTHIVKKSKSLDLKSLCKSKVTKETPNKSLKRKGSSSRSGDEKSNKKKKKTRKEVSISKLENADGGIKKIVDEECHKGSGSGGKDLLESKLEERQRLGSSGGLSRVSLSFDEDGVHIPKRKRDFVGRRKLEVGQALKLAGKPSCVSGEDGNRIPKLSSDDLDRGIESLKIKQKKNFDELKVSRTGDSDSVRNFKGNEEHASHSVVNTGYSSLQKPQRKDKKRKALAQDRIRVAKAAGPRIDGSEISDYLQEDDEENLEENAARMLSSRFDPSYTGFCSSSKPSTLPSSNSLSFGSKSQSSSVDTAGRALRPRKQHKEKGNSRKRRHFYEILLSDLDANCILNQRIKVFWPSEQSWCHGLVNDYDKETKLHHVKYDNREEEWINLQTKRFKILLLPSEVPNKAVGEIVVRKSRSSGQQKGNKSRKETQIRDVITEDDSCTDTEPIISWLARSSHWFKSSVFHGTKKHKTSVTLPSTASSLLYDEPVKVQGCLAESSPRKGQSNLPRESVSQDKSGDNFVKSSLQSFNRCKDEKQPIVYFRRRFRRPTTVSPQISEGKLVNISASCSLSFDPVIGGVMDIKEPNDGRVGTEGPLWFTYNVGVSNFFLDVGSAAFKFDLNYPIHLVLNESFRSENLWLLHAVLLLQYGTLMTLWPIVHLEMLFVDNVVGLRFLLFEGCLKMAAALVFWVLRVFHQPADQGKYIDLQLPATSIRFRFSSVNGIKKPLVFAFYNFSRVKNSKWINLDLKLERHCQLSKQLHLSECTYDNIQVLQNGSSEYPITSVSGNPSVKVMQKRTRPGINIMGVSREFTQVDTNQSSDVGKKISPFSLSFAAAPTFFLGLHLKLLMQKSIVHISFCDHALVVDQEEYGLMTDDCSNWNAEFNLKTNMVKLSNDAVYDGVTCAKPDLLVGPSNCGGGILSQNYQNIDLSADGTSGSHGSERPDTVQLPEWQSHHSGLFSLPSSSLTGKVNADDGSHSFLRGLSDQNPSVNQFEKPGDCDLHDAQHSSDFSWNINGGVIPSPHPIAPRSSWHRNGNSSSSLGFQSHGWSDVKVDSLGNDFSNGPKKPRTLASYSVPFAGYDFCSRHGSHHQRGSPHKRIRKANEKSFDVANGSEKNLESLYCHVNLLITLDDKGWRESGAQVVLELFDHNERKLSVKLAGITRYTYKAHRFLQTGSTNRYTQAMMWKGGKDWILEFPDRSQWALFKEMHEECYNQNIRAASVKNIPIPGVVLIEENHDNESAVTFVRSPKYFLQVETDVEMALNPLHVLYDMDSDDEQWILTIQNSEKDSSGFDGVSKEMFEKTMDMFEKAAYAQQHYQFTPAEIEELMDSTVPFNVAEIICEHWQKKRQKKGMSLIRHFQPPLWERYQQELREWEVAMTKNNIHVSNGCLDRVSTVEKPPMVAFCFKPRGLEVLNKGLKHRSQKKISVSGHTNSILHERDGFHPLGRRLNGLAFGNEKFAHPGHDYDSMDDSPLSQTSLRVFSPRDAGSMGYYSMSNGGYDRNHIPKHHTSKSRRFGSFVFHNDSQVTSYSQRIPTSRNRNGASRWNMGYYDLLNGPWRHGIEQVKGSDLDEFRLRDASGAAQHAHNMAKLKRERAQRLLYRADQAIHKAVVALMTAEAMKTFDTVMIT